MRIIVLVCIASLAVVACDNQTDNIRLGVTANNQESSLGAGVLQEISLEAETPYAWSVRAITPVGTGEWSPALEFSIHNTEALALANASDQGNDLDFLPGIYSDSLPVSTVVSFSPAGSILDDKPTFKWLPVNAAESYEVRVINTADSSETYIESFAAGHLCSEQACQLNSGESSQSAPTAQVDQTINIGGSETDESGGTKPQLISITPEVGLALSEMSEAASPIEEVEPEPVVVAEPVVAEPEPVVVIAEPKPVVVVAEPEPEVVAQPEPQMVPAVAESSNSDAINAEIESLQRSEGVLAFPGAVGYAKNSIGGRGGRVVVVNTVEDIVNDNDGFMSLREAIEVESGPRTVVFAVGGIFDTGANTVNLLGESGSNVTVACQTAPSPGVVIKTYGLNVQNGAHDIILRHCRIRGIDAGAPRGQAGRSMTVRGGSRNILLDHMSLSWTTDEGFQAYLDPNQTEGFENITVSNSIVAEGDADSSHPESIDHPNWGYHAMGPSCLNNNTSYRPENCSIVNNFIAHNSSRNAMIWGGSGELSNNIVYNWYTLGLYAKPFSKNDADVIVNNNLMKSGPNTVGATSNPACGPAQYKCGMALGPSDGNGTARYSVSDNYYLDVTQGVADAQLIQNPNAQSPDGVPALVPATPSDENIRTMAAQGSHHMNCVGASRPIRDAVDARVISEFYAGTGAIGIGDNIRNGGHNVTQQRTWDIYGEPTSHPADYDSDQDGMEDQWEISYGLNPNDSSDHSGDLDGDGYTNLEEYLAIVAAC